MSWNRCSNDSATLGILFINIRRSLQFLTLDRLGLACLLIVDRGWRGIDLRFCYGRAQNKNSNIILHCISGKNINVRSTYLGKYVQLIRLKCFVVESVVL